MPVRALAPALHSEVELLFCHTGAGGLHTPFTSSGNSDQGSAVAVLEIVL